MRTNIVLDDALVEEAFKLTGAHTKRELVRMALQELIRSRNRKNLLDLAGTLEFREDYDHKVQREMRGDSD